MVFSSIPSYFDPANWQQQQSHQAAGSSGVNPHHHHLPPPPPAPPAAPPSGTLQQPHGSGSMGSIRPGSMAERARLANIPTPEAALKCPRCESTNTKFCYFNNYSLSQPRHFCKTCRRYWTRGGALRNVPVGGGCRRNKRSKGKSSANGDRQATTGAASSSATTSSGDAGAAEILGLTTQMPSGLRFLNPLSNLHDSTEIGLNYGGTTTHFGGAGDMSNFHLMGGLVGPSGGAGENSLLYGSDTGQWRFQLQQTQVPFLGVGGSGGGGGLISQTGPYHLFEGSGEGLGFTTGVSQVRPKSNISPAVTQQNSVKMEADNQEVNYSRQLMGMHGNEQYWGTSSATAWNDQLSGFSSSSTSNPH